MAVPARPHDPQPAGAPRDAGDDDGWDLEPDDDPQPISKRRIAMLLLAVALGTAAFFWVAAALTYVYVSRPSASDGPLFSIGGAALQALVGVGGAMALAATAIAMGDRATGGDGPWYRPALVLTTVACAAGWIVLAITTP